jgi:hypothetical protein
VGRGNLLKRKMKNWIWSKKRNVKSKAIIEMSLGGRQENESLHIQEDVHQLRPIILPVFLKNQKNDVLEKNGELCLVIIMIL